jgi:hypothetical protein
MWSTILLLIITILLIVSSSAYKKINFNKPKCNLYYINNIHKHMLQNQKPSNSLVIQNMISRFSKHSGQTVEHIKACLSPEKTNNNPKQK